MSTFNLCTDDVSAFGSDLEKACHSLTVINDWSSTFRTVFIADVCFAVAINVVCVLIFVTYKIPVFDDVDKIQVSSEPPTA